MACGGDYPMIEVMERQRLEKELEDFRQRTEISFGEAIGANAKPFYDEVVTTAITVDWITSLDTELNFDEEIILTEDEIIIFDDPGFFSDDADVGVGSETWGGSKKTAPKSLTQTFENIDDHRLGALSKADEGYGD